MRLALRATRVLAQQKPQISSDPFTYHTESASPLWEKVRKALVVKFVALSCPPHPGDETLLTSAVLLQPVSTSLRNQLSRRS
jgi:hypothetical protein